MDTGLGLNDSVPLGVDADTGLPTDERGEPKTGPRLQMANLKLLLALFLIFVMVVSDVFTNSIIAGFGEKAVRCRNPTSWGTVLQGTFLVIFYCLALYLSAHDII
jgi:hypothetical protein